MILVEQILREGAASLAQSMHFYWPATGNNEVAEANITAHMSLAFGRHGYLLYAEAPGAGPPPEPRARDLLAIHLKDKRLIVFEFKRWTTAAEVVSGLRTDLERVRTFQAQPAWAADIQGAKKFGVIATTVWSWYNQAGVPQNEGHAFANWFSTYQNTPTGVPAELEQLWIELRAITLQPRVDAFVISSYADNAGTRWQHWLAYAIVPLP